MLASQWRPESRWTRACARHRAMASGGPAASRGAAPLRRESRMIRWLAAAAGMGASKGRGAGGGLQGRSWQLPSHRLHRGRHWEGARHTSCRLHRPPPLLSSRAAYAQRGARGPARGNGCRHSWRRRSAAAQHGLTGKGRACTRPRHAPLRRRGGPPRRARMTHAVGPLAALPCNGSQPRGGSTGATAVGIGLVPKYERG